MCNISFSNIYVQYHVSATFMCNISSVILQHLCILQHIYIYILFPVHTNPSRHCYCTSPLAPPSPLLSPAPHQQQEEEERLTDEDVDVDVTGGGGGECGVGCWWLVLILADGYSGPQLSPSALGLWGCRLGSFGKYMLGSVLRLLILFFDFLSMVACNTQRGFCFIQTVRVEHDWCNIHK